MYLNLDRGLLDAFRTLDWKEIKERLVGLEPILIKA